MQSKIRVVTNPRPCRGSGARVGGFCHISVFWPVVCRGYKEEFGFRVWKVENVV